jgi:hypothetical protein
VIRGALKKFFIPAVIFFLFIFIPLKGSASEAEKIELEVLKTKALTIKNISSFFIINPEIIKVERNGNSLLLTGTKTGSTLLHVRSGDEFLTFAVYTYPSRKTVELMASMNNSSFKIRDKRKYDYGYYNVKAFALFSPNTDVSSQNLFHNIYYSFPAWDGNLSFKSNFLNNFSGWSDIKNISMGNFLLTYENKALTLNIGDIGGNYSPLALSPLNNLQGINLYYVKDRNSRFHFFGGIEKEPVVFYRDNNFANFLNNNQNSSTGKTGKDNYNPDWLMGGSGYKQVSDELKISANYFSRVSFSALENSKFNLSGGLNWNNLKNIFINSQVATNFSGLAFSTDGTYRYDWTKTGEWAEARTNYLHYGPDYLSKSSGNFDTLSMNLRLRHLSDTIISGGFNYSYSDLNINKSLQFQVIKNINDRYNFYAGASFSNSSNDTFLNRYSAGFNLNLFLPVNFTYNLINGNRYNSFYTHDLRISSYLFSSNKLKINLTSSLRFGNTLKDDDFISRALNFNSGLSANVNILKNLSTSLSLGYNLSEPEIGLNKRNNSLSVQLKNIIELSRNSRLNVDLGFNFSDQNDNTRFFSSMGYQYSFGQAVQVPTGNISGVVFEDANNNSFFDLDEKVIPGIKIKVDDNEIISGTEGYTFKDLEYGSYDISLDKSSLPKTYRITTAPTERVIVNSDLKKINYGISNKVLVRGHVFGSKSKTFGLPDIKVFIGSESTLTDVEGYFSLQVSPGKYVVQLDYKTLPSDYFLDDDDSLTKNIEVDNDKQVKDTEFIFKPFRNLSGALFFEKDIRKLLRFSKELANIDLKIEFFNRDEKKVKELNIKTDRMGGFILKDIEEGAIKIYTPLLKEPVIVEIPETSIDLKVEIPIPFN